MGAAPFPNTTPQNSVTHTPIVTGEKQNVSHLCSILPWYLGAVARGYCILNRLFLSKFIGFTNLIESVRNKARHLCASLQGDAHEIKDQGL